MPVLPDVRESRHCVAPSASATLSPDRSRSSHEQPSQEAPALVRGAVGGPPRRTPAGGPRAKSRRWASARLIDRVRRTLRPCHPTPAHARPSAPRVRLHLKPGQKGTKQLDGMVIASSACATATMPSGRRGSTVELRVAERDWEPPRRHLAHDRIVGLRVAFADVAVRDRVKQAGGRGIQIVGSGSCATIASSRWPDRPHCRRAGIQVVDAWSQAEGISIGCPDGIQVEMLASTGRCRHPVADDGVAVDSS